MTTTYGSRPGAPEAPFYCEAMPWATPPLRSRLVGETLADFLRRANHARDDWERRNGAVRTPAVALPVGASREDFFLPSPAWRIGSMGNLDLVQDVLARWRSSPSSALWTASPSGFYLVSPPLPIGVVPGLPANYQAEDHTDSEWDAESESEDEDEDLEGP